MHSYIFLTGRLNGFVVRRVALASLAIATAALLAACDAGRDTSADLRAGSDALHAVGAGASDAPDPEQPSPSVAPPGESVVRVTVAGEGLRLVDSRTGSARPLDFGSPRAQVVQALTALEGETATGSVSPDCGEGLQESLEWRTGLITWFQSDEFVGWSLNERHSSQPAPLHRVTTMGGVGLGSTRAEMEEVYVTTIEDTSLGVEFSTGGFHGILDSRRRDAVVTNLWAGMTCIFR
jgi:hypothetical protein